MSKIIVYTGAPLPSSLSWGEEHLTAPLQPCFLTHPKPGSQPETPIPTNQAPKWRSIPLSRQHLPTGLTQSTHPDFGPFDTVHDEETSFLSASDFSYLSSSQENTANPHEQPSDQNQDTDILSEYYEHSFIAHQDLLSSQVLPPTSPPPETPISSSSSPPASASSTYYLDDSSTNPLPSSLSVDTSTNNQKAALLKNFTATTLTLLSSIPTAKYLHSITPQTMTVNLLVGIIALPPPRTITTKKDNRTVQLVEMIVGDETRAGFGVNVWLAGSSHVACQNLRQHQKDRQRHLEAEIQDLRPRDIILMRNIALTSFRGKVYGQSLRRGMTGVELVWRGVVDEEDRRGWFSDERNTDGDGEGKGLEKIRRVKGWVLEFVGGGGNGNGGVKGGKGGGRGLRELPNDTQ